MVEKIKNEIRDRRNIFWSLTVSVMLSLGFYMYFLSSTIYTAVSRQQTEKFIIALEGNLSALESNYLNLKNTVTVELALTKGFKDVLATHYISRKLLGKSLTLNTNTSI